MKIKRFIASSMREAIRLVREEQGADAVILGNRRVEGGVEIVAATDYDAALIQQALARADDGGLAPDAGAAGAAPDTDRPGPDRPGPERPGPDRGMAPAPNPGFRGASMPAGAAHLLQERAPSRGDHSADFDSLKHEMSGLRLLLQQNAAGMAWSDLKTRNPVRADVVRQLTSVGLDLMLAREIAAELPDDTTSDRARFLPMGLLTRRLPVFKHEWLDAGGVIALVGATGVGKTTTIAKLAARYIQHWGLRDVALVTTDHFRIGAQEQLFTYGRLLGVPVITADNQQELCLALDKLKDRKLVLIDTAGMSPRDSNLEKQFAMLSGLPVPNRTALVLAANSQSSDLDDQVRRFAPAGASACILTKLDEATRVGAAISSIVRSGLPLAYTADGQRVPEDLAVARADQLVLRAMQLARRATPMDDEELSLHFAGAAHA